MKRLPSNSFITSYEHEKFTLESFRSTLKLGCFKEYGGGSIKEISHHKLVWQNNAIKYLESLDIKVEKEKMFSSQMYKNYKVKYGV